MTTRERFGLRDELSGVIAPVTALVDVNDALAELGARVWTLNSAGAPTDVQQLVQKPSLTEAEAESVKTYFLSPREGLLELIHDAGLAGDNCFFRS